MEVLRKPVGIIHFPFSPSELIYPLNYMTTRESPCEGKWSWCISEAERLQSQETSQKAKVFPGQLRLLGPQYVFPPFFCLRLKGCFRSEYCDSLRIRRLLHGRSFNGYGTPHSREMILNLCFLGNFCIKLLQVRTIPSMTHVLSSSG